MRNAFPCVSKQTQEETSSAEVPGEYREILTNRRYNTCCTVQTCDGDRTFMNREGILQGDGNACEEFLRGFGGPVREWQYSMYDDCRMMTIVCPFTKSKHDSGMFKFIDDILKFIPLASHTAKEAVVKQRSAHKRLDSFLSPAGFAQNVKKAGTCPWSCEKS
jgi:hypothetical protein